MKFGDGSEIAAHSVVLATGVSYRALAAPGVADLTGRGVFYGSASTEAPTCRGLDVYIVGGANSAGQAAVFFSRHAKSVTLLVRGPSLEASMSYYLIKQLEEIDNVCVRTRTEVVEAMGEEHLQRLALRNNDTGESGKTLRPPTMITSLIRPHSTSSPSIMYARSPAVRSQPSSNISAVAVRAPVVARRHRRPTDQQLADVALRGAVHRLGVDDAYHQARDREAEQRDAAGDEREVVGIGDLDGLGDPVVLEHDAVDGVAHEAAAPVAGRLPMATSAIPNAGNTPPAGKPNGWLWRRTPRRRRGRPARRRTGPA